MTPHTAQQLRAERAGQVDELEALLTAAEAEARVLNADEHDRFETIKRAIVRLDDQLEETRMEPNEPQGQLRPLVTVPTRLSDAIPADLARQVETAGRCAFEFRGSLRQLAKNIIGTESLSGTGTTSIAAPASWRLIDGYIAPTPSLLELLPRESATGSSILQNIISYSPPDNAGLKAAVVAEAATKPSSDITCTPSTIVFQTYAHWVKCTRQVLADIPALRNLLDSVLTRGLMAKVDAALLTALTTAGGTFTAPAGANGVDSAAMAMATLACMGGSGIIVLMNCLDAAKANIAKTDTGAYLGRPAVLDGRIVASPIVPQGQLVAFSRESGFVAEREQVSVVAGIAETDFIQNAVRLLAEWRGALVLSMPQFILSGPIAAVVPGAQPVGATHARART